MNFLGIVLIAAAICGGIVLVGERHLALQTELAAERKAERRADSRDKVVREFVRYYRARQSRAGLLVSAIDRSTTKFETRERKKAYDQAYQDWNSDLPGLLYQVKSLSSAEDYRTFSWNVVHVLTRQHFADLDRCVTKMYDNYVQPAQNNDAFPACSPSAGESLLKVLKCGEAIANQLFHITGGRFHDGAVEWVSSDNCPDMKTGA